MKFALLGWHPAALPFVRAISEDAAHQLVVAAEVPGDSLSQLLAAAPGVRVLEDWQAALSTRGLDAFIIAGSSDTVLEATKQVATDGRTIVLLPCAAQGSAFIYELTLVHDDNRVPLIPVPSLAAHPLVEQLRSVITDETLGRLVLMRIERTVRGHNGSSLLSREQIDAELFDDAALLRSLGGNYDRVTAVHSGGSDAGVSLATVTLGGAELAEATWIARTGEPSWTLTATGSTGSATLTLSRDFVTHSLSGSLQIDAAEADRDEAADDEADREAVADDGARHGSAQLEAVLHRIAVTDSSWASMTRSFETVEATHTSLRRRRTIDLYFETTSERSIFKSQMTAFGCGLVMLTLFSLVAFLLLGAFLDSRSRTQRNAEADGRVVQTSEFNIGSSTLNRIGRNHLSEMARKMERAPQPILVMPEPVEISGTESEIEALNNGRVESVVEYLIEAGHTGGAVFVELAAIPNPLTVTLLVVLRYLWIAPMFLFLGLQTLIFVTRPSTSEAG